MLALPPWTRAGPSERKRHNLGAYLLMYIYNSAQNCRCVDAQGTAHHRDDDDEHAAPDARAQHAPAAPLIQKDAVGKSCSLKAQGRCGDPP